MENQPSPFEQWLLAQLAGLNSGYQLFFLTTFFAGLFLLVNSLINLNWQSYFSQPLCH